MPEEYPNINALLEHYYSGEITRPQLKAELETIGFSQQIVDIYLMIADRAMDALIEGLR